jgi:hypothetical protein
MSLKWHGDCLSEARVSKDARLVKRKPNGRN